jgi:hypothetical protein
MMTLRCGARLCFLNARAVAEAESCMLLVT